MKGIRRLARAEARRRELDAFTVHCLRPGCTYRQAAVNPEHARELSEQHLRAAHAHRPRLEVRRAFPGAWMWRVKANTDGPLVEQPCGLACSQREALVVGLAALETTYARAPRRRPDGTRWDVRS